MRLWSQGWHFLDPIANCTCSRHAPRQIWCQHERKIWNQRWNSFRGAGRIFRVRSSYVRTEKKIIMYFSNWIYIEHGTYLTYLKYNESSLRNGNMVLWKLLASWGLLIFIFLSFDQIIFAKVCSVHCSTGRLALGSPGCSFVRSSSPCPKYHFMMF